MALILYGIPHCDTVKKARLWLDSHTLPYQFHDFKKMGVDTLLLQSWLSKIALDALLNRKSSTWRKLSNDEQAKATVMDDAIILMQNYPSLIKRPILSTPNALLIGFTPQQYQQTLVTVSHQANLGA